MLKNLCYHTHNFYCDGKNSIEEMVQEAINLNIIHLGISSHAPLKVINPWSLPIEKVLEYAAEIDQIKKKYANKITIYKSLEIDYIPGKSYSFQYFTDHLNLDYTIGSIHLVQNKETGKLWFIDGDLEKCHENLITVFDGNIRLALSSYYNQIREMINTQKPDIIGHLDKAILNTSSYFFEEQEDWYIEEVTKTLQTIQENESILEINTRGMYKKKWNTTFPSPTILKMANKLNIPIIISTDAHHITELMGNYDNAVDIAKSCGYKTQMSFDRGQWNSIQL